MSCTRVGRQIGCWGAIATALFLLAPVGASAATEKVTWITDPASQCSTSNPFKVIGESIRWYGGCQDGRLHGSGTLIWYQDGQEKERNSGVFRNGEFSGEVITTFPDGQIIVGNYREGIRHGMFTIIRADGQHFRAVYNRGKGETNRGMTAAEIADWQKERAARAAANAPAPRAEPQVAAVQTPIQAAPARPVIQQPSRRIEPPATRAPTAKLSSDPSTPKLSNTAPTVAALKPTPEEEGLLDTTLKVLNPLNWYDAVVGFIGFDEEPRPVEKVLPAPKEEALVAARQPKVATPTPHLTSARATVATQARPAPRQVARAQRPQVSRPSARQAVRRPAPVVAANEQFRQRPAIFSDETGGKWYDMNRFLSEPHPFEATPSGKSWPGARSAFVPAARRIGSAIPSAVQQPGVGAAKALLGQAVRLEQQSRPTKADTVYEQVVSLYPTSPSAAVARQRISLLRTRARELPPVIVTARRDPPASIPQTLRPDDGGRVVAINSPLAPGFRHQDDPNKPAYLRIYESDWIGKSVCSRSGLYDENANWCGVVQRDDGGHLVVTIRDVTLDAFGMIGITRSRCTGGAFLNWFSRGSTVRVPKQCMAVKG